MTTPSRSRRNEDRLRDNGSIAREILSHAREDDDPPYGSRVFSGLMKNDDGENTYTGIVILFDSRLKDYLRPDSPQREVDEAINSGTRARGILDGEEIVITRVEVEVLS